MCRAVSGPCASSRIGSAPVYQRGTCPLTRTHVFGLSCKLTLMTTSSQPSTRTVPATVEGPADRRRWIALVLLCLAQFMLIVDVTVVNVALPSIGADLAAGREALTWVVTAYALAFGGLMLLGGRLADVLGRRNVLLAGLVVFTLASLASGLAVDEAMLIAGRVAQGVGAALMSPAALSIITTTFHGAERNRALGVWAGIGGSGGAGGGGVGGGFASRPGRGGGVFFY